MVYFFPLCINSSPLSPRSSRGPLLTKNHVLQYCCRLYMVSLYWWDKSDGHHPTYFLPLPLCPSEPSNIHIIPDMKHNPNEPRDGFPHKQAYYSWCGTSCFTVSEKRVISGKARASSKRLWSRLDQNLPEKSVENVINLPGGVGVGVLFLLNYCIF